MPAPAIPAPRRGATRTLAIALAAAAALTPALGAPSAGVAKASGPPRSCFYSRNIDGFSAPDDRTVFLRVGVRDVYEVKLFAPCTDIDWNQRIAVRARGSAWICEGAGAVDLEIISRSPIGPQRCQATAVRKLSPVEVAAMPRRYRP